MTHSDLYKEFDALKNTEDPPSDPSITDLVVLSGFHSYLQREAARNVDGADDFNRIELAILRAREITAIKLGIDPKIIGQEELISFGPTIFYLGSRRQIQDLKNALETSISAYPASRFELIELPTNEVHTKGQFICLKELHLKRGAVGFVTHAYHFPRICRMVHPAAALYPFEQPIKKFAFLVDRTFTSAGVQNRIEEEIKKIRLYIEKGDLFSQPAQDIRFR